ncbi:MAG: hypothetical protein NWE84_03640 [Candidatus Bathyarchaeota archaeon]|nr:hypothetical protein [Candidatus Bathyarchaeota archaeon]
MSKKPKSPENYSSTRINKLYFLIPIFFTILIALIYSQLVLASQAESSDRTFLFEGYNEMFIAVNIAVIIIISALSLLIFFHILKTKRDLAIRVLISSFIMGGMVSTLLFGKHIFILLNFESPLFLLVVAFVAYIGAYFAYLAFIEALSNNARNALFLVCSGTLGSFLGVLLPMLPVIIISLFLSVADIILISRNTVEDIVGKTEYERLIMKLAFSNKEWAIGIGDLTCYSMIVANTSLSYGALAGGLSLLLILIGSFLTLLLTIRLIRVPGLPISAVLGLLPSISLILGF